jgi:hypothetical protein
MSTRHVSRGPLDPRGVQPVSAAATAAIARAAAEEMSLRSTEVDGPPAPPNSAKTESVFAGARTAFRDTNGQCRTNHAFPTKEGSMSVEPLTECVGCGHTYGSVCHGTAPPKCPLTRGVEAVRAFRATGRVCHGICFTPHKFPWDKATSSYTGECCLVCKHPLYPFTQMLPGSTFACERLVKLWKCEDLDKPTYHVVQ